MKINKIATNTCTFLLAALKQFKQPLASSFVEPLLHEHRDEFLEIRNRDLDELKRSHFLETRVEQIQSEFELHLEKTIVGRDAYVYRHLMRKWFCALCEKYRYEKVALDEVRSLWLTYLSLLEQVSLSKLLSIRSHTEHVRACYRHRASEDRKSYMMIEGIFARQIGEAAVQHLQRVNESEDDSFDRSGRGKMAPDGYHYFCISFEPHKEELRPRQFGRSPT